MCALGYVCVAGGGKWAGGGQGQYHLAFCILLSLDRFVCSELREGIIPSDLRC